VEFLDCVKARLPDHAATSAVAVSRTRLITWRIVGCALQAAAASSRRDGWTPYLVRGSSKDRPVDVTTQRWLTGAWQNRQNTDNGLGALMSGAEISWPRRDAQRRRG
jgi:hypothetical protein